MSTARIPFTARRPSWVLTAVFALMAMVFMACGGDDGNGAAAENPAPDAQQVLRVRINSEPRTLDPQRSNLSIENSVNKSLFQGLFTYDENLKLVPNLATEVPSGDNGGISDNGLTYTVRIQEGATWSDGSPLTANDFVYSLKRALDPKLAGPYVSYFYSLVGARDYATALGTPAAPKTPSDSDLTAMRDKVGVTAKDQTTIVYQLTEPNPSFLNQLALWTAYPVKQDVIEKFGDKWTEAENHVGNGPFKMASWEHGSRIVLEANPNYSGKNKPLLSRIEYNIIADDTAAYASYLAGELDVVTVPPAARRDVASPASGLSDQLRRQPELGTFGFFFNQAMKPFDNVNVRKAFAQALDRDALIEGVLQGAGRSATSWIPPGMPGYNAGAAKNLEYNVANAKKSLADAGYKDGAGFPQVTLLFAANDTNRIIGQFVQDQLKQNLGINVDLDFVDGPTFGQRFTSNQHQATILRWGAEWPYPDNWLPGLFSTGVSNNHTGYSNPAFDELMKKAASNTDDRERLILYDAGQKMILDDAVISPLFYRENFILTKPYVKNHILTGLDGYVGGDYNFAKTYIAAH
ncbi:MAG: ABC transporter substrate-binding protein [Dehalococcoidia bacterium]